MGRTFTNGCAIVGDAYGAGHYELDHSALQEILKDAFNAGCAYTIGSHKDFKQTHHNCSEFMESYIKDNF